uniref:AlNc14C12G1438 protein n=1 Tax=Albugo laibachii Nc14 TaxID=890382 RepID=F0W361_9STRA|nr:AlNc14C12G1438 [Albugo laibachii Nc14]|eukprot:CCA15501.1 AlNc14C12G1438 [Albugo laibachii Nc14]
MNRIRLRSFQHDRVSFGVSAIVEFKRVSPFFQGDCCMDTFKAALKLHFAEPALISMDTCNWIITLMRFRVRKTWTGTPVVYIHNFSASPISKSALYR